MARSATESKSEPCSPFPIVSANLKTSSRYYSLQPFNLSASESASSCPNSDTRTPRDAANVTPSLAAGLYSPSQNSAWTQEHTTPVDNGADSELSHVVPSSFPYYLQPGDSNSQAENKISLETGRGLNMEQFPVYYLLENGTLITDQLYLSNTQTCNITHILGLAHSLHQARRKNFWRLPEMNGCYERM